MDLSMCVCTCLCCYREKKQSVHDVLGVCALAPCNIIVTNTCDNLMSHHTLDNMHNGFTWLAGCQNCCSNCANDNLCVIVYISMKLKSSKRDLGLGQSYLAFDKFHQKSARISNVFRLMEKGTKKVARLL